MRKRSLVLKAPAKLNLYLNILGKRKDGYHEIVSVMEKIDLYDSLKLVITDRGCLRLFCNWRKLQAKDNLAFKAAELVRKKFKIREGIDIFLTKRIPVGSGLGGASSDAAAVLIGLNRLLRLKLGPKQLLNLGAVLGSDVNFFFSQTSFALVKGRGEIVEPIKSPLKLKHFLIVSNESISTAAIYRSFRLRLTKYVDNAKLITTGIKNADGDFLAGLSFNSLTKPYLAFSRKGREIFKALSGIEECPFFLSGSGSAIAVLSADTRLKSRIDRALRNLGVKTLPVATF
jgi:4-diphosphocytidyl-2-C-methyl-D-erythritol kinase